MKSSIQWIVICAVSALLTQGAFAHGNKHKHQQAQGGTSSQPEMGPMGKAHQSVQASDLIGKEAKNAQGEDLGKVKDISFSGRGRIFAILDRGAGRYVAVPWGLLKVSSDKKLTLNLSKKDLDAAPTLTKNEFKNLSDPSFRQKIYSYFRQQQGGAAMGAPGTGSESMKGGDQSKDKAPVEEQPKADENQNQK